MHSSGWGSSERLDWASAVLDQALEFSSASDYCIFIQHLANSDRTVAEPWERVVAHADMDAFYASVEQLDDPKLRGHPVIVGPRSKRGVVLTASYEARPFGVGSAMPMVKALRLCPDAIVVPPRFERYTELSARIMEVFEDFSPDVEPLSLDEAFLDMTGSEHLFGPPRRMGEKIKAAIKEATGGLTASVGLSQTKYVAKVASGYQKPDGLTVVPKEDAVNWLAPQSVARLWGAGPKTQARLYALGYQTIGDIAGADLEKLQTALGSLGNHLFELANARDPRRIEGHRVARSMGCDRTLNEDVSAREDILLYLRRSADHIARRLRRKNYLAGGVRVRLKTTEFKLLTRQCTLAEPTDVAQVLYAGAQKLLDRFDHPGPFRLVGLAAHSLEGPDESRQLGLLDAGSARALEVTLDRLAERFGDNVIRRARDITQTTVVDQTPDLDFLRS